MSLYQRDDGSEIWYIDIRHGGGRIRRSTKTTDKLAAKRIHDELAARAWKIREQGKRLSDALHLWLVNPKKKRERSASTVRTLTQIRAHYPDRPLSQVTEESIEAVFGKKAKTAAPVAPGTYNKIAAVFRAALNLAHRKGWIDAMPDIARRSEPKVEPTFLTAQQWKALRRELPEHLLPMADFAIATGLRWSNVAGLEWERVSLTTKLAWIPARTTKALKTIPVPLSEAALRALRSVTGARKGPVFLYEGRVIQSPKTAWNKATARAGMPGFRWHDLRHTWASWHAMRGTPLDVLQKLGGWETREMVEVYAHLAPDYVAQYASNARPFGHSFGHSKAA
jgi:integrase